MISKFYRILFTLIASSSILLLVGCQKKHVKLNNQITEINDYRKEIESIKSRIKALENQLIFTLGENSNQDKSNNRYIKSLTFRIGSSDDRLRIYWSDGTSIDLPCLKEQSVWACG